MLYLGLLFFSYVMFVFVSDCTNPFVRGKTYVTRRRWKLGRNVGLAVFFSGLTALLFGSARELSIAHQGVVFLFMFSALILFAVALHKRHGNPWR